MTVEEIPPILHLRMCLLNQYVNTPILDKIKSPKELPENIEDYLEFDMKKNLEYAQSFRTPKQ